MHNLHTLSIIAICVACWLLLDVAALAILMIAREYSHLRHLGRGLLRLGSQAMFALPGVIFAALLVKNASLIALQPAVYAIGATSSCVLLDLCMNLE